MRRLVGACSIAGSLIVGVASRADAQVQSSAQRSSTRTASHDHADAGTASHASDAPDQFRETTVVNTTDIGTGSAPTTAQGPVGSLRGDDPADAPQISGPIGPADVARVMQVQMPRLRPCYDQARATRPDLTGRIDTRFTIGADGRVTQATATGMPDAPEVATCIATILRATTFPQPEGGPLPFVYPITFVPPPHATGRAHAHASGAAPARTAH